MRMETIVGLYGKGNEIISWHSFYVGSCLVLSGNYHHYMCYCCWSTLHQIYTSQIHNDNIHRSMKIVYGDDNIQSSLCVVGKRWKTLFYTWAPLSDVIATMVSWSVSWVAMRSLSHMQCNKWIPKSLLVWPHLHHERCRTIRYGIHNVVKKWAKEDKCNEGVLGWINNQAPIVGHVQEQRHASAFSTISMILFFGLLQ
jgi:hypothetical protein